MPVDESPSVQSENLPADEQADGFGGAEFPVVGVGASAGGLEALTQFLKALPVDTGMGFVIVQHLAPERESGLVEILARATKMPVREVRDEPVVEPDQVYVIPPGREMTIAGGKLRLLPLERSARHRGIDQFFHSLAGDCGHRAIAVVLSGAMTDGTLGIEEIKAEGGITFAQDDSAQHGSMPRSAVDSGCVDFVLSPAEIAREIARIARHPYVAPEREGTSARETGHARIAQILHRATGADFTHYKANTLHRRITRRMVLHKMETLAEYEAHLEKTPGEIEALYQDILINVTSFFRDPEAFAALTGAIFPALLAGRTRQEPLRLWTLGCSTGEEAYSLAIAFTECAEALGSQVPLRIFATDLNATGVAKARAGLYAKSIAQDVSAERLRRFFTEEEGGYRISKAIREQCLFSQHNALDDPPFSRVDFISCRNVLIYMEPVLQQQIVPLLHYALKPGGYLWLGSSETAGTSRALFEVVDARQKIYVRQPGSSPSGTRFRPAIGGAKADPFRGPALIHPELPRATLPKEAERILLTKYVPPGVVISAAMEIVHFRGDTGAYLAPAAGAASMDLLKMLREGLLVGVRAAIRRAGEEGRAVREEGLRVKSGAGSREVAVEVVPITAGAGKESGFLVLFEEAGAASADEKIGDGPSPIGNDEVARLTQELAATRAYLQDVIEQQETVNEELQSANEEAQSANEEMQSVNEELETSKEEIQSSNEELVTVNDELHTRNAELNQLTHSVRQACDYAENIVASLRSPLVVLDAGLRVRTASAAFYETFHVEREMTEGRRLYDLGDGQWNIPALRTLLEDLLKRKERIDDFEVRHTFEEIGPRVMLLNARRLAHAAENEPQIVLSIEDITDRQRAQDALRESEAFTRSIIESSSDCIKVLDLDGNLLSLESGMELLGIEDIAPLLHKSWIDFWEGEHRVAARAAVQSARETGQGKFAGFFRTLRGEPKWWDVAISAIPDAQGRPARLLAVSRDITTNRAYEDALVARAGELAQADRSKDEFLAMLAHELRNPLAPLSNAAEILQAEGANTEERGHAQTILARQVGNMTRMIDDLLDVSRITEGKIELRPQVIALADILTAAVSVARSGIEARGQELKVTLPAEPVFLNGDATRLEQVFGNLLGNACKYSEAGCHISISAEVAAHTSSSSQKGMGPMGLMGLMPPEVIVRVCDDGMGIAPDLLPHIFDLFVQATRALDRAHGGLGIGLTLVHRLVKLHGGSVEARSGGIGQGSEFIVHLPILARPVATAKATALPAAKDTPRRMLIVDDNEDSARSMATLQRLRGHETHTAFTGPDAVAAAAEFLPNVVLLDIGLPGMDGYEVAARLRAIPALAGAFLVAMSGYGSPEDIARARAAGFDEYLVKPADLELLRAWLRSRV